MNPDELARERNELLGRLAVADQQVRECEVELRTAEQNKWGLIGAVQLIDRLAGRPHDEKEPT